LLAVIRFLWLLERRALNMTHSVCSNLLSHKVDGAARCFAIGQAIQRSGRQVSANPKGRMPLSPDQDFSLDRTEGYALRKKILISP
jgi:hypothetical protein